MSMSMSSSEIKQVLRKQTFPDCAKGALERIGELICSRASSIKHMDLALDLMSEFVFYELDRRGNKRTASMTAIIELRLLDVMYEYLNSISSDSARNSVFLTLFSGTAITQRLSVLGKLVSIAIAMNSGKVLVSASTWMQQLGNSSVNSCRLAEVLVNDYFILLGNGVDRLKALPDDAPQFTANFMTAVGELYFTDGKGLIEFPPKSLLEIVVYWLSENTRLCVAAQLIQSPLPPGAIAMEATTPLGGLIKWCVLAPLYNKDCKLYSQLHLCILNSLLEIPQINPPRALSTQHLSVPIVGICRYTMELNKKIRSDKLDKYTILSNDRNLQLALDRYAQAIQVALSVNCVYGNADDFVNQLMQLPQNVLMGIVIQKYKRNKI